MADAAVAEFRLFTSQFWSNCYLNSLDWFISRELGCPAYLRYVDDRALFSDSKRGLAQWQERIVVYLAQLRLTVHRGSAQAQPVRAGIPWLGFVVYPTHRLLKWRNVVGFRRRLEQTITLHRCGDISFAELDAGVRGWINHVRYGDTWGCGGDCLGCIRFRWVLWATADIAEQVPGEAAAP